MVSGGPCVHRQGDYGPLAELENYDKRADYGPLAATVYANCGQIARATGPLTPGIRLSCSTCGAMDWQTKYNP